MRDEEPAQFVTWRKGREVGQREGYVCGAAVAFGLMGMAEMIGRRCCFACGKFGGMDPPGPDGNARWVCDCVTRQEDRQSIIDEDTAEYLAGAAALGGLIGMAEAIRKTWKDKLRACDTCGKASGAMTYAIENGRLTGECQCWSCGDRKPSGHPYR